MSEEDVPKTHFTVGQGENYQRYKRHAMEEKDLKRRDWENKRLWQLKTTNLYRKILKRITI